MRKYSELEVKEKVEIALGMLLKNDAFLPEHDVNERSISHKLAEYLQQLFPDYHVDCEYNRIGKEKLDYEWVVKKLDLSVVDLKSDDDKAVTVFPDIIVHSRGERINLLVIEMKKEGLDYTQDMRKLKAFTSKKQLGYSLGCFIQIKTKTFDSPVWYRDGQEIKL